MIPKSMQFVPTLNVVSTKLRPKGRLDGQGVGFPTAEAARQEILDSLVDFWKSIAKEGRSVYVQHPETGSLIKTKLTETQLFKLVTVDILTRRDRKGDNGITGWIYNAAGEPVGQLRIFIDQQLRATPMREGEDDLVRAFLQMGVEEQRQKQTRVVPSSATVPSAPAPAADDEKRRKAPSSSTGIRVGDFVIDQAEKSVVISQSGQVQAIIPDAAILTFIPFTLVVGRTEAAFISPKMAYVFQLNDAPTRQVDEVRHLWATTENVYDLRTGYYISKDNYTKFKSDFTKMPADARKAFKVTKWLKRE
jgi:hypothetical protein